MMKQLTELKILSKRRKLIEISLDNTRAEVRYQGIMTTKEFGISRVSNRKTPFRQHYLTLWWRVQLGKQNSKEHHNHVITADADDLTKRQVRKLH